MNIVVELKNHGFNLNQNIFYIEHIYKYKI